MGANMFFDPFVIWRSVENYMWGFIIALMIIVAFHMFISMLGPRNEG
jgi:hypothetical protein